MSELSTAARPYARAIYELAKEHNSGSDWSDALSLLAAVCSDPQMEQALDNPVLTHERVSDLVISVCGDHLKPQAQNLVRVMSENGRLSLMSEVTALFEHMLADDQGQVDAEMVSAFEVSDAQRESVIASLKKRFGRDVRLQVSIDESLIGGAVIRAGDLVIDGSVRGRMEKMSTVLGR